MQSISNIIIKKTAKWAKPLLRLTAALIALTFFCPPALATTMDDILSLAMIFHALYNLLVSQPGLSSVIGYVLPLATAGVLYLPFRRLMIPSV